MNKTQSRTFDTGDINFTSAAMSMGFPLNDDKPCSIIQRDNGRSYARFHLLTFTMDGLLTMDQLSAWWSEPDLCSNTPFANIMSMIKAGVTAGGISTPDDWLDFIIGYLSEQGIAHHPKNMGDIPAFIDKQGEHSLESQLCAFAYNRNHSLSILRESKRAIMMSNGTTHLRLDEHLPLYKRNELLAKFRS